MGHLRRDCSQKIGGGQPGLRKLEVTWRRVHQHHYAHPLASNSMYQQRVTTSKGSTVDRPPCDHNKGLILLQDCPTGTQGSHAFCSVQETIPVLKEELVEHTMNLSVCCKHHGQIHPRDGHCTSLWHGSRSEELCAITGPRIHVIIASLVTFLHAGQWWGDTSMVWEWRFLDWR